MKREGFVKVNNVMTVWKVKDNNEANIKVIAVEGCGIEIPIQQPAIDCIKLLGFVMLEDTEGNDVNIPVSELDEVLKTMEEVLKEVS